MTLDCPDYPNPNAPKKKRINYYDPIDTWDKDFRHRIRERLKMGKTIFHNTSVRRPLVHLVDEILEEIEDVCAWSAIVYGRVKLMKIEMERRDSDREDDSKEYTSEIAVPAGSGIKRQWRQKPSKMPEVDEKKETTNYQDKDKP